MLCKNIKNFSITGILQNKFDTFLPIYNMRQTHSLPLPIIYAIFVRLNTTV